MVKVLIAEDEKKSREAMVQRVRDILGDDAMVEGAADGNEAVQKAIRQQPDIIFMDIEMPYKNGLEAAAIIRKQVHKVHVIFLTAYDRFDYAVGAIRSGADEYLLKPVSDVELKETLQQFMTLDEDNDTEESPFETAMKVWLRKHFAENLSLDNAAESMGMSSFYFSRQVKVTFGKTYSELVTGYRMEKAIARVRDTELPFSEIGKAVGYPDSNYFTKVFKRYTGLTPSDYRLKKTKE